MLLTLLRMRADADADAAAASEPWIRRGRRGGEEVRPGETLLLVRPEARMALLMPLPLP